MFSNRAYPQRVSIVASTELPNRNYRLDPTRYNERAERIVRHFRETGIKTRLLGDLPGVSRVFVPPRFKRPYVADIQHGKPFLGSSSMLALRLPTDSILSKSFKKLKSLTLDGGEVLLSCSGTIGVSVLCGQSYKGFAVSQHAARIFAGRDIRGYLHAYLSSAIGRELVLQQNYGKVIKELTADQIKQVLVPVIDPAQMTKINEAMIRAAELYDSARTSLDAAEEELLAILSLPSDEQSPDVWVSYGRDSFLKSSGDLLADRLDPHFHTPRASHLRHCLLQREHKALGTIASLWMPTRFARPRAQRGFGVPFYSSTDVMRARRLPSSTVAKKAKRFLKQCTVEKDTILICRSGAFGGIMGRATYTSSAMDGWAVTEHVVRCKVTDSEFLPEYVCALLASMSLGYPLITAYRHGKDVPELDPTELGGFPVPVLPKKQQERVSERIRQAFNAVDEANAHEAEAIASLLQCLSLYDPMLGASALCLT